LFSSCDELLFEVVVFEGVDDFLRVDCIVGLFLMLCMSVYNMCRVFENVVDFGLFFELKCFYGWFMIIVLVCIDGCMVGIVVSNLYFKGGVIDFEFCLKVTSFIVLCDLFNVLLVFVVD